MGELVAREVCGRLQLVAITVQAHLGRYLHLHLCAAPDKRWRCAHPTMNLSSSQLPAQVPCIPAIIGHSWPHMCPPQLVTLAGTTFVPASACGKTLAKALHAPDWMCVALCTRNSGTSAAVCPSETLRADCHGKPSQALGVLVIHVPQRHAEWALEHCPLCQTRHLSDTVPLSWLTQQSDGASRL